MARKHNTKHDRAKSRYRLKRTADRYGHYQEGVQKSADIVAASVSFQKKR